MTHPNNCSAKVGGEVGAGSGANLPGFESLLHLLLAVWSWPNYKPLSLSFLTLSKKDQHHLPIWAEMHPLKIPMLMKS